MRSKDLGFIEGGFSYSWDSPDGSIKRNFPESSDNDRNRGLAEYAELLESKLEALAKQNRDLLSENDYLKNTKNPLVNKAENNLEAKALEISGFGTWELDIDTNLIKISDVVSDIYGLEHPFGELTLEKAQSLIYHEDTKENSVHIQNLIIHNIPYKREFRIQRINDNQLRWVRTEAGLIYDKSGKPQKIVGTIRDITSDKLLSQALEKSEESHRIISDMISDFVYVVEKPFSGALNFQWINKGLIYIYGYSKEEISNFDDFLKIVYPKDREKLISKLEQLKLGKETITEYRIIDKIGGLRWVRDFTKPVFSIAAPEVERLYGALQDITISKLSDTAQRNSHHKLRSIFDTIPGSICVVDKEMNIMDVNYNFLKLYGIDNKSDIITKNFREVINSEMIETEVKILKNVLSTGTAVTRISIEDEIIGNKSIYKINTNPIKDDNGDIIGAINVYTDITDLKAAETQLINLIGELSDSKKTIEKQLTEINAINSQLKQSEEKLRQLNSDKDKLFSIIAHDLRNPLSSILNYTEIISSDFESLSATELKQYTEVLNNSARHLNKLLENLLEWSRSQTGGIVYKPVKFNLNEIVFDNVYLFQKSAQVKKIELEVSYAEKPVVIADYNMIDTVVRNLVSNAVKFTNAGGRIEISISGEQDNYLVEVKDNGIGMSESELKNLFSLDKTVSRIGTANEKGTGLGLLIIKEFISMHSSEIEVDSKRGEGSAFRFRLKKYEE